MVCIDLYSHFPEVKLCGDVTSKIVIEFLKSLFVRYGLVNEIISDNGAQFVSREFEQFVWYSVYVIVNVLRTILSLIRLKGLIE